MEGQVIVVYSDDETRRRLADWLSALGWQVHLSDGLDVPAVAPGRRTVILLDEGLRVPPLGWYWRFRERHPSLDARVVTFASRHGAREPLDGLRAERAELPGDLRALASMLSPDGGREESIAAEPSGPAVLEAGNTARGYEKAGVPPGPLLRLDGFGTPDQRMEELTNQLRAGWNVRRVRLYRVERLFDDSQVRSESVLNSPHVLVPVWQRGHGFKPGKDWHQDEFVIPQDRFRELFGVPHAAVVAPVSDRDPATSLGCKTIEWGDATTRAMIPLVADDGAPVGLLALDRRGAYPETALTLADIESLMAAGLDRVLSVLSRDIELRLKDDALAWVRELTDILTEASREVDGRKGLTHALGLIVQRWERGDRLDGMYMVREHNKDLLEAWAGTGAVWEARTARRHFFEVAPPYDAALQGLAVIQDVQAWRGKCDAIQLAKLRQEFGQDYGPLLTLGGWLGMPLPKGGPGRAILVVGARKSHYFTETRVRSLAALATRLTALGLWALAEAKQGWMALSLSHTFIPNQKRLAEIMAEMSPEGHKFLTKLFRFQQLVFSSLKLLAPDADEHQFAGASGDVNRIVEDVRELLDPKDHRITVVSQHPSSRVRVAPELLEIAFFNLLENAVKHSIPRSPIEVSLRRNDRRLVLDVRNHVAAPIPAADRDRIWGLFERVARWEPAEGTGIGLALISKFCELTPMRCLLSDSGDKTNMVCFTLDMPLLSDVRTEHAGPAPAAEEGAARPVVEPRVPAPALSPLLHYIDDTDSFRPTLQNKRSLAAPRARLLEYIGLGAVERFMHEFSEESRAAWFLLDVSMSVPGDLKTAPHVWPRGFVGDARLCGIALAAWLVKHCGVDPAHIALLTSFSSVEATHAAVARDLGLSIGDGGLRYIRKFDLSELEAWLRLVAKR